jgi:histidine racemase
MSAQHVMSRRTAACPSGQRVLQRVTIAYPSGNTTAVLRGELPAADRTALNGSIMRSWKAARPGLPEIEQCCFLSPPVRPEAIIRVEMMGGEFCGNATRSGAFLAAEGRNCNGRIEVSGASRLLGFRIRNGEVAAEMPLPENGDPPHAVEEGTLVQLDGIAQLVVTDADLRTAMTPRQLLESLVSGDRYGLAGQPAAGVSYYDRTTCRAVFCVWVNNVGTIFDETACGSGTCAIGVAAAMAARGPVRLPVRQPSGEVITTDAEYDPARNRPVSSAIAGQVRILYDGGWRHTPYTEQEPGGKWTFW